MRLHEILSEAQFVNMRSHPNQPRSVLSVEQWLHDYYNRLPYQPAARKVAWAWMEKKVPRYLAKYDGPAAKQITPAFARKIARDTVQPWIEKAVDAGQKLFVFSQTGDAALLSTMNGIIDWMVHLSRNDPQEFAKLDRYSFEQADQAQRIWHEQMAKKSKDGVATTDGAQKVLQVGPLAWWRLDDACALSGEGEVMGHCVGGYDEKVANGNTRIYSLRDDKGRSHVTVEASLDRGYGSGDQKWWHVDQVKGKGNAPPVERYHNAIQALVDKLGLLWRRGRSDMEDGGAIRNGDQYVVFSEVAKKVAEEDGMSVYTYLNDERLSRGMSRVFIGRKPILTAFITVPASDMSSWPRVSKFDVADNASAEDLVKAYPFLWKVLQRDYENIGIMKRIGQSVNHDVLEIIKKAGYVSLRNGGFGTPQQFVDQARAGVLAWVDDHKQNGFGAIDTYVLALQKFGGKSQDEALAEVKTIIPKMRLTSQIRDYEHRTGDTFLFKERYNKSWNYWFWDKDNNRIYEKDEL